MFFLKTQETNFLGINLHFLHFVKYLHTSDARQIISNIAHSNMENISIYEVRLLNVLGFRADSVLVFTVL